MSKMTNDEKIKIKRFVADLIHNRKSDVAGTGGKPSVVKIVKIVEEELNLSVTRPTVTEWLKGEDMGKYLIVKDFEKNEEVREYNELMKDAKSIWKKEDMPPTSRTKAYNSYLRAKKQKEDLLRALTAESLKQAEIEKPVYLLSFKPGCALRTCPKCNHQFYDKVDEDDEDTKSVKIDGEKYGRKETKQDKK